MFHLRCNTTVVKMYCLWPCSSAITITGRMGLWFFVVLCPWAPEGSPAVALVLKRLRRWCHVLKSHPTDWDKPGIEPVKILLALEPYGLFGSNLAHLFFLILKQWIGFAEHHFGRSRYFSGNAYNSWTTWHILINFFILIHFNIVETQVCKTVTRLCQEYFPQIPRPCHTALYNVSELAPLLQWYMLSCVL